MELIRTIKENRQNSKNRKQAKKNQEIFNRACHVIGIGDFDDSLYIAYRGVPLIPIEGSWTTKEIIEKLHMVRQNYINAVTKGYVSND